jgi:cobalt-zinc-cadmium resistance protein CzcA
MIHKLIDWALHSPVVVLLLALALVGFGARSFLAVNVEAYPDPAPAIVEVVAQYPGASAEEVERQVTIPLEVALAGMPGLTSCRSKSLFGLAHLRNQFDYGVDFNAARQEVINRLQNAQLPGGVTPQISPTSPTGEIFRYTLKSPKDAAGHDLYTLSDLKALQDWTLQREFLRLPGVAGVVGSGGTVKRYEVQPDADRLQWYGITLQQLQSAISAGNANVGGDYLVQGDTVKVVRGVGLIGGGQDPVLKVLGMTDPRAAAATLRAEERKRLRALRRIVIAATDNVPVRVDDVVEGGPVHSDEDLGRAGVVVGHQTRQGRVSMSRPRVGPDGREVRDAQGNLVWDDEDDKVQGIVLLRKGAESLPVLRAVEARVRELNETPGKLLPGVKIEPYYDRTELIGITTETVRENLFVGMVLVSVILLMFLSNVRTAVIVALNIPLALLFAFSVLYLRGKSANLLSIGAVDFGIIVDSSVIMVENVFRHLSSGESAELPLRERILLATREMQKSLFFSTVIMVCALLPLFTMKGPEGQIFGPMADTYAFALGGALLLALVLSPVLCLLLFRNLKPARDNFLVRGIKAVFTWQLEVLLAHRWLALGGIGVLVVGTACLLPLLGREFMPELEEGNLWVRGTFPVNVSLDEAAARTRLVRAIMRKYPEVESIVAQIGRPDDGTDPTGFYNVELFVPLRPASAWPAPPDPPTGRRPADRSADGRRDRPRTKPELVEEMNAELSRTVVGVDWGFSQNIRDNVMESLSGVKGENSVKIFGPDLGELERLAEQVKNALAGTPGVEEVGVFRIQGQSNLELVPDDEKCSLWGVSVDDVNSVIATAVGGRPFSQMIEGEKSFDVTLRWPARARASEEAILDVPVDLSNHKVSTGQPPGLAPTPVSGGTGAVSPTGTSVTPPSLTGSQNNGNLNPLGATPRRRLRDLVKAPESAGAGGYARPGASTIFREQGQRLIAIKFGVRGRDLAGAVAEAQAKVRPLLKPPYEAEWSGEFQEMQEAEERLVLVVGLSLVLICVLLYLAFRSLLDVLVVLSNVVVVSMGGVWALLLTGTNFNISAAVGFISILGVAVMNGLILVSSFNQMRAQGVPLREAILTGFGKRVRPLLMTLLTAIFGLLPAALSTRIGAQSQRPLAIVVVGGMVMTLALTNLVPLLYSFYGHREPPEGSDQMAH